MDNVIDARERFEVRIGANKVLKYFCEQYLPEKIIEQAVANVDWDTAQSGSEFTVLIRMQNEWKKEPL